MADPHVLYVVTGVVVAVLVMWVMFVLIRAPNAVAVVPAPPPVQTDDETSAKADDEALPSAPVA
ncbi:unnamed protein product, partial [marine sediment metagenome]